MRVYSVCVHAYAHMWDGKERSTYSIHTLEDVTVQRMKDSCTHLAIPLHEVSAPISRFRSSGKV